MDLLDYLSYEPNHREFLEVMITLFGPDEVLTALCYGNIMLDENVVRLNIQ
jgi:hypothetical protein